MAAAGKDATRRSNSVTKGYENSFNPTQVVLSKMRCVPYPWQFHGTLPAVDQVKQFGPP
jgi:hypothetical protein